MRLSMKLEDEIPPLPPSDCVRSQNRVEEMGSHYIGQAHLKLLALSSPPTLASQNAGITDMSHHLWPFLLFKRQGLALSPRLQCSGPIIAQCSLELLGSSDPPASIS
ncbi:Protein PPP5D1 [Plecturocebus cupreus]